MQKNPPVAPAQTVHDLAHFAWCAQVALQLARQDGQALSPLMTHTFLLRWLATAQKQRRFPRTVAPDIESLLILGRQKGPAANLFQRLEYLHNSCTSPVKLQSDLFRLTYAIESLKVSGWQNISLPDDEWHADRLTEEFAEEDAIMLIQKSALVLAFTDDGMLKSSLDILVKGHRDVFIQAMAAQELTMTIKEGVNNWAIAQLIPVLSE